MQGRVAEHLELLLGRGRECWSGNATTKINMVVVNRGFEEILLRTDWTITRGVGKSIRIIETKWWISDLGEWGISEEIKIMPIGIFIIEGY